MVPMSLKTGLLATSTQIASLPQNTRLASRRAFGSLKTSQNYSICYSTSADGGPSISTSWNMKLLYDGDCPLCMREVDMLKRRDAGNAKIAFVDISSPDFNPSEHGNVSYEAAMERIHAVLPDGSVVVDIEVFRRAYENVGLGWVYSVTKVPVVEKAANALYNVWAKYRLPITGRPDLAVVLSKKASCGIDKAGCEATAKKA